MVLTVTSPFMQGLLLLFVLSSVVLAVTLLTLPTFTPCTPLSSHIVRSALLDGISPVTTMHSMSETMTLPIGLMKNGMPRNGTISIRVGKFVNALFATYVVSVFMIQDMTLAYENLEWIRKPLSSLVLII